MADSFTPTYNFIRPEPGGSVDTWGLKLNANFGDLDTILSAIEDSVSAVEADAVARANNLSDLANTAQARTNLGLGTAAVQSDTRYAHRSSNLSDLQSASQARTNLGLGTAATLSATDVARVSNNLADLPSPAQARTNLELGTAAVQADTRYMHRNNSLGDLGSVTQARTNLGLGSAATQDDNRYMHRGNNLSDIPNVSTARANLGLGAAATAGLTSSRTSNSSTTALAAAGMNDHRTSSDHDARYLRRDASGTLSGNLSVTGNITAYSSDARLKTVLGPLEGALAKVRALSTVKFRWDEEACWEAAFSPVLEEEHGVLAQEVQKVLPDAVHPSAFNEEYLTVDYGRLVVLALAAIKELEARGRS